MNIPLSNPDVTQAEIDAVVAVMKTPILSLGPKLPEFENACARYIGRKYAVAVNSGTSALHLCMLALNIKAGDEVITTPYSFIATSNSILMAGAKPVFVDIDPVSYNIDIKQIPAKITGRTKAVVPVEVFGNPDRIDEVWDLAQKHKLLCIEDSCEALGSIAKGRKVGTLGDISVFAFYPNKQMTTGEGGIILTDNEKAANLCNSLRNQGRDPDAGWLAHARLGYNYRLCDINCALGIEQLKRLESFIVKRQQVADLYNHYLADETRVILPPTTLDPASRQSWFVYVIRLQDNFTADHRSKLMAALRQNGIGCNNYFSPIHLQPFMVEQFGYKRGDFPVTERIADRTIALPFFNNLSEANIATVVKTLKAALDSFH